MLIEHEQSIPQALINPKVTWWKNIRIVILIASFSFSLFFIFLFVQSHVIDFYSYETVPDQIILARSFFRIPNLTTKFPQISRSQYHFVQDQFYPLYLRLFLEVCFSDSWFSIPLAVFFQNLLFFFTFYFMISTCSIVHNPFASVLVLIVFPFSFINQRNTAMPSSLSLSFVFLSFAFLKQNQIFYLSIFTFVAVMIEFQGIIAGFTFFTYFLMTKKILNALIILIVMIFAAYILSLNGSMLYQDQFAIFRNYQTFFSLTPFASFIQLSKNRPLRFYFQTLTSFFLPSFAGIFDIYFISIPHFIYCMYSFILLIFFNQTEVECFFSGFAIFSIVIGFDKIWIYIGEHIHLMIIVIFVCLILFLSAYVMRFDTISREYLDYSMNLVYPFIDI